MISERIDIELIIQLKRYQIYLFFSFLEEGRHFLLRTKHKHQHRIQDLSPFIIKLNSRAENILSDV